MPFVPVNWSVFANGGNASGEPMPDPMMDLRKRLRVVHIVQRVLLLWFEGEQPVKITRQT
jgi:hypothetical protein